MSRRIYRSFIGLTASPILLPHSSLFTFLTHFTQSHCPAPTKTSGLIVEAIGNLDFDARVPIPFSVFPSSYRDEDSKQETKVNVEGEVDFSQQQRRGREDTEARYQYEARFDGRQPRDRVDRKETRIYEETDRFDDRRRRREDVDVDVDIDINQQGRYKQPYRRYANAQLDEKVYDSNFNTVDVDVDVRGQDHQQRDYQQRDYQQRDYQAGPAGYTSREHITVSDTDRKHKRDMGYYDEDGHYHSLRHGIQRATDRIAHPIHGGRHHHHDRQDIDVDVDVNVGPGSRVQEVGYRDSGYVDRRVNYVSRAGPPNTITIPCHHIRIGDLLILQGRPCQVIRITTSASTGQHRYLGVDLFTKQLFEESSFASNPSPSIYVQNMLGPVFKQYRVLDIRSDGRVTAMTETGDIKQALPVIDQSQVFERMSDAFDNGRGSVRALVINDAGRELAVDYKVVHGSRL